MLIDIETVPPPVLAQASAPVMKIEPARPKAPPRTAWWEEELYPVLLIVLTPFLFCIRWTLVAYQLAYVRTIGDIKVSNSLKCPACGIRQEHKMTFSETYQALIHQCARCSAEFASPPVVAAEKWHIERLPKDNTISLVSAAGQK